MSSVSLFFSSLGSVLPRYSCRVRSGDVVGDVISDVIGLGGLLASRSAMSPMSSSLRLSSLRLSSSRSSSSRSSSSRFLAPLGVSWDGELMWLLARLVMSLPTVRRWRVHNLDMRSDGRG